MLNQQDGSGHAEPQHAEDADQKKPVHPPGLKMNDHWATEDAEIAVRANLLAAERGISIDEAKALIHKNRQSRIDHEKPPVNVVPKDNAPIIFESRTRSGRTKAASTLAMAAAASSTDTMAPHAAASTSSAPARKKPRKPKSPEPAKSSGRGITKSSGRAPKRAGAMNPPPKTRKPRPATTPFRASDQTIENLKVEYPGLALLLQKINTQCEGDAGLVNPSSVPVTKSGAMNLPPKPKSGAMNPPPKPKSGAMNPPPKPKPTPKPRQRRAPAGSGIRSATTTSPKRFRISDQAIEALRAEYPGLAFLLQRINVQYEKDAGPVVPFSVSGWTPVNGPREKAMRMIYEEEEGGGGGSGAGGKVVAVPAKGVRARALARAGGRAMPYDPDHIMRGNKYDPGSPSRQTFYQADEIKKMLGDEYESGEEGGR